MRTAMEGIFAYWPVVVSFVAVVVWLVRLEAGSAENTKEIKRLWNQRREDLEASRQSREETNKMLAEIRDDIKALISKVGK
jgi:methyl-accepting chemotaxis protein